MFHVKHFYNYYYLLQTIYFFLYIIILLHITDQIFCYKLTNY